MTDSDVVERAAKLLGAASRHQHQPARYAEKGWKPVFIVGVRGARAVEVMRDLYPLMGQRRQAQIDRALATYTPPRQLQISEADARELARRYHAGDRRPTALGQEYGLGKNSAIYYINKYTPG
jgi:hypothetical protein